MKRYGISYLEKESANISAGAGGCELPPDLFAVCSLSVLPC